MRHRNKHSRLSMMTAHRKAMLRNMVQNLFKYERIETTLARAKAARRLAEHLISISKDDSVASRRRVYSAIPDRDLVKKLFTEITPLFKTRNSGFTRIIQTDFRRGDGATLAMLELTERKIVEKLPKKKKEKADAVKAEGGKESKAVRESKAATAVKEPAIKDAAAHKESDESKKDATRPKAVSKGKSGIEEEKRAEKAKSEDKKIADQRGFMKNIRGIFRKRGDR